MFYSTDKNCGNKNAWQAANMCAIFFRFFTAVKLYKHCEVSTVGAQRAIRRMHVVNNMIVAAIRTCKPVCYW